MNSTKSISPEAVYKFKLKGEPVSCERYGKGHIHKTYLVVTDTGKRYILQDMNREVFKDIPGLMSNISAICDYLHSRTDDERRAMRLIYTHTGEPYYQDDTGAYRVFDFVENSICEQEMSTKEDFYQSALAFGRFLDLLKDFPAEQLVETIPHFHDTPDRYRIFREKLEADVKGRAAACQPEIEFYLKREAQGMRLMEMLSKGELPLRVTHNDTKINNVMLDEVTREGVCVIDLDTTMPGLSCFDFGDSIRFGAATAPEDEKDASKMGLDLEMYETYTRGFLEAFTGLTDKEKEVLPLGALTMTLENGLRFLTDYLDGDNYFFVDYPEHNLIRSRTQIKMVESMEANMDKMQEIVRKYS